MVSNQFAKFRGINFVTYQTPNIIKNLVSRKAISSDIKQYHIPYRLFNELQWGTQK